MKKFWFALISLLAIISPLFVSAHEAYVLTTKEWDYGIMHPGAGRLLGALTPENFKVIVVITLSIVAALIFTFFFRLTSIAGFLGRQVERLSVIGPIIVRLTFATALFFSAHTDHILGPELPLSVLPYDHLLRATLYIASICIALGFLTEIMALASLAIFILAAREYGAYIITYLNYLGEIIVLLLFGSREWSIDRKIFGPLKRLRNWSNYKTVIVRICYGLALIYAAVNIKLFHPLLTIQVVNDYHLNQFHWLFPHDPLLIALGAAITEIVIGLFIIFGFEMRLTVLVSVFYITLSLLFFREAVWPHLLLYGISFNLLVEPEVFTLDHLVENRFKGGFLKGLFRHGSPT
ncbi:hypothetical protein KW790_03235 [Candidatus Parcubacteria bacterium]|nr:hypothetical protein [Candidatus Parcubacteria bacterium]